MRTANPLRWPYAVLAGAAMLTLLCRPLLAAPLPNRAQPDIAPREWFLREWERRFLSSEVMDTGTRERAAQRRSQRSFGGSWVEQGPAPIKYGQQVNVFPDNEVVGAVNGIAVHPSDPNIMYLAAVNGGVWKTTNATAASPAWVPLTDGLPLLSVGDIQFDPADPTHNTLVASFGRFSSFYGIGGTGAGILRTTDGGNNWTVLSSSFMDTTSPDFISVAARGATILAAASKSLLGSTIHRSTDTGATWVALGDTPGSGLPAGGAVYSLVGDPLVPTRFYAATYGTVYRSDDTGATWTNISSGDAALVTALSPFPFFFNVKLAAASSGRVYVGIVNSGALDYIAYSDDPTAPVPAWTKMDLPLMPNGANVALSDASNASPIVITSANHGLQFGERVHVHSVLGNTAANGVWKVTPLGSHQFALNGSSGNGSYAGGGSWRRTAGIHQGNQGDIHFALAVDPSDPTSIYVGGDRESTGSLFVYGHPCGLFRGSTTAAAGATVPSPQWAHIVGWPFIPGVPTGGTGSNSAPHADARVLTFDGSGDLLLGGDGGIFRRTSPLSNLGDWFSLVGSAGLTEMHSVAYDRLNQTIIGGTQDNATAHQIAPASTTWSMLASGDGGSVIVADDNPPAFVSYYFSSQFLIGFTRQIWDASNAPVFTVYPALTPLDGAPAFQGAFLTPVKLNRVDPMRLLLAGTNRLFESTDQGESVRAVGPSNVQALSYGGRRAGVDSPHALHCASGNQVSLRLKQGAPVLQTASPFPGGTIIDLVSDPEDWNTIYVADVTDVYRTTDAGKSWQDITGNLYAAGAAAPLRSIDFIGDNAIVLGSNAGAYRMPVGSPASWEALGTGLPNAPVLAAAYDSVDDVLVVSTMGRGAWKLDGASGKTTCPASPSPGCQNASKASLSIGNASDPKKRKMKWSWTGSGDLAEFASPVTNAGFALCLYDSGLLKLSRHVAAGGMCNGKVCWKQNNTGFKYKTKGTKAHGLSQIGLKSAKGTTRLAIQAKGSNLPYLSMPFDQAPNVTVQLVRDDGVTSHCWQSVFVSPSTNLLEKFADKLP